MTLTGYRPQFKLNTIKFDRLHIGASLNTKNTKMRHTILAFSLIGEVDGENVKKWRKHSMWVRESEPWMQFLGGIPAPAFTM